MEDVLSKEVEQRMLNALEEKVDLAIRDLQRCGHLSRGVTGESTAMPGLWEAVGDSDQ